MDKFKVSCSQIQDRPVRRWLFLAWMSAARQYAEEQSGILGKEIAKEQGSRQVRKEGTAQTGLDRHPRVGA